MRNLNIAPPTTRNRGRTTTDDEYNLKTPAKLLASGERASLHASRSYSDLPKPGTQKADTRLKELVVQNDKKTAANARPRAGRRKSTLHWAGASPNLRQQKLEDVALERLVDTWFSIHHPDFKEPVYISEVMHRSMNPSFSSFDLDTAIAQIARSDTFELKIWSKTTHVDQYKLLLEMCVNLKSLQYIGKSLENFHHPLPQNCVLFHLSDGIYTTFVDLPAGEPREPQLTDAQRSVVPTNSATYDALMKLANLDDCIQDALQLRQKLEADINDVLAKNKQDDVVVAEVKLRKERIKATKHALDAERKRLEQLMQTKASLERSRDDRKGAMQTAEEVKQNAAYLPLDCDKASHVLRADLEKVAEMSRGQIRRICEDLLGTFPIEPVKNRALQFTIRGIHLPNSVFDDTNRDEIAAALGFTSQLVYQLSMYLSIPLPYRIEPNASSSFISDTISVSLAQRRYPLHPTNVNYKFEYGVFLLNKDIEFLMSHAGLRVLDIRHTLPNLKYLLYILTAGTGELPARKVGGIRGLLGGIATPNLSRRSSEDSVHSRQDYANGRLVGALAREREKSPEGHDPFVGMGRVKGLPYRNSLLREAG